MYLCKSVKCESVSVYVEMLVVYRKAVVDFIKLNFLFDLSFADCSYYLESV